MASAIALRHSVFTKVPIVIDSGTIALGAFCVIEASEDKPVHLGRGVVLGHHVTLQGPVTLEERVEIRAYGSVEAGSKLGFASKLLYGGSVHRNASVGKNCIIGGSVADGTVIGDDVTFLGAILHNYRTPGTFDQLTDGVPSPSPRVHNRAVVGEGSFLMGDIDIGEGAYVAAGMMVKCSVPPEHIFCEKGMIPLSQFRGFISGRVKRTEASVE